MNNIFFSNCKILTECFLPTETKHYYDANINAVNQKNPNIVNKISHYTCSFFKLNLCVLALPFTGTFALLNDLKNRTFSWIKPKASRDDTLSTTTDEQIRKLSQNISKFGFSDSLYQSSGLGTSLSTPALPGRCDWNRWVNESTSTNGKHIEGTKEEYKSNFKNFLTNPEAFIAQLEKMNVTSYRFSLERSVIEPVKGQFDQKAIDLYQTFCKKLLEHNIEPIVTLNHFVMPSWFSKSGGWSNDANAADFVQYSNKMFSKFPEIKTWMTFNEPGVDVFQRHIREKYPNYPGNKGGIFAAMKDLKNIMTAHVAIYEAAKKNNPNIKVGITHQWLKFVPANSYNLIERITCFVMSLITHYAVFDCLRTGSIKIPFVINAKIWDKKETPIDFIGVQCYGFPVLKIGFGSGKEPGEVKKYKIFKNFQFITGATCKENGKVLSFGPCFNPDDLGRALTEAKQLKKPISITETGCDAKIKAWGQDEARLDNATQKEYFQRMFKVLTKFKIEGLYIWTLFRKQLEWENGNDNICLGLVDSKKRSRKNPATFVLSPAAEKIQEVFGKIKNIQQPNTLENVS